MKIKTLSGKLIIGKNIRIIFCLLLTLLWTPKLFALDVDQQLKKGIDLTYNAQFNEAKKLFDAYVQSNPQDPLGYMLRGIMFDWQKQVTDENRFDQQSIDDLKRANQLAFLQWDKDQNNIDKMIKVGNSYMFLAKKWVDLGKKSRGGLILKKAKKHMEEAIKMDPKRYDAYLASGVFNFYMANLPPGFSFLAALLGMSGNEALGLERLQIASTEANLYQTDALFVLAYAMGSTKKDYDKAFYYLDQLIQKYPHNPYFLFMKARYGQKGSRYAESNKNFDLFFKKCTEVLGKCPKKYLFLGNYYRSVNYEAEGKLLEAKAYVEEALENVSNNEAEDLARMYLYRGLIYLKEGNKDKAKEFFLKVGTGGNEFYNKAQEELKKL